VKGNNDVDVAAKVASNSSKTVQAVLIMKLRVLKKMLFVYRRKLWNMSKTCG